MRRSLETSPNAVVQIDRLWGAGSTAGCIIDVKMILQYALKTNACGIIIAHNHPSGNLQPSESDIHITKKLSEAAKLLDISLLDHLIITPCDGYYSLVDEGYI